MKKHSFKIQYRISLLLLLGVSLYSYSNENAASFFSFKPSPLQISAPLPSNTPVSPLCPPHLSFSLCLSLTSFLSTSQTSPSAKIQPQMLTPVLKQRTNISKRRVNTQLRRGRWRSLRYSRNRHRYEPVTKEERVQRRPQDTLVHLQEAEPEAAPAAEQSAILETPEAAIIGRVIGIPAEALRPAPAPSPPPRPAQPSPPSQTAASEPAAEEPETAEPDAPNEEPAPSESRSVPAPEAEAEEPEPAAAVMITAEEVAPTALEFDPGSQLDPCVHLKDSETIMKSLCIECNKVYYERHYIGEFKRKYEDKVTNQYICTGRNNDYITTLVKQEFNSSCSPVSFDSFVQELTCQSCQNNIPPAIMLAILTAESNGDCNVFGSDGKSVGLFQPNTTNSTAIPTCSSSQKQTLRQSSSLQSTPRCLENPMINLQEGLRILAQKYKIVNKGQDPQFSCQSPDLQNKSAWSKAIAAYNGGEERVGHLQEAIQTKPTALSQTAWDNMSEWEKMKTYYFSCSRPDVKNQKCSDVYFDNSVLNLAHTELILGSTEIPHLFQQWNKPGLNDASRCSSAP